jgi:C1A family cysteine protease
MPRVHLFIGLLALSASSPVQAQRTVSTRTWTAVQPYAITVKPVIANAFNTLAVDLRPRIERMGIAIRDQGLRGTCSVHAITFVLEYQLAVRRNVAFRDLSEEYLNAMANLAAGNTGDGDYFSALDMGYQKYGMTVEALYPYRATYSPAAQVPAELIQASAGTPRLTPVWIKVWDNTTGATAQQLEQAVAQIQSGSPVAVGMYWPQKGYFATTRIAEVDLVSDLGKAPSGRLVDGHSVVLVGFGRNAVFPGGGYFIFRNSWGMTGDKGYGYVSFAYLRKYANDLVTYQ